MRTILAFLMLATPALAQDREGNDTPGEWVVTHQQAFGLWESFCDERTTGDLLEERCYLRYVDVYSQDPFGAAFVFVTPGAVEIALGRARTVGDGVHITRGGETVWSLGETRCAPCTLEGEAASTLLEAFAAGGTFHLDFEGRSGETRLAWDLAQMADALDDYRAQSAARGLSS
ncbi:MAG: hypothetical protein AAFZ02_05290 [Pseudomonadota bacterium]